MSTAQESYFLGGIKPIKRGDMMVDNNECGCAKFQVGNLPEVSVCGDNIWEAILGAGILLGLVAGAAYIASRK